MNSKSKPILVLLVALFWVFTACDKDNPPVINPAQLSDVQFKQTVNNLASVKLTDIATELNFVSQLTFNEKTIEWSKPTFEQSFNNIFNVSKDNISVTDSQGNKISSVDIAVNDNNVKISFVKVSNSYAYMTSSTFSISIKTSIKENASNEELNAFNNSGFESQSIFYGESAEQNIKSDKVTITSNISTGTVYDVKGDPDNDSYPYKLNVVYFVASDIEANPGYEERISTVLLKHQLFVRKWMKHWGYEEKSFGLPLRENGMVDIITVNAKGPKADYPYAGGNSKIMAEVNEYYQNNGLSRYSDHMLIISAINGSTDDTPFYGTGKSCFALDYPGMSFESMAINPITGETMSPKTDASHKATVWIGGMLHELGHGLNEPHVGPTYSHKNSTEYGISLMGSGNRTYGETPTYMHPSSAAIMNNCQLSAKATKTYYDAVTASIKISSIVINGDKFEVKGTFDASHKVTDVIVRFHNALESYGGGAEGYTSVAFVIKPVGNTFEASIPIEEMRGNTFDYKMGMTILMENGMNKHLSRPYVYKLVNKGGYTFETEDVINDGTWEVTTSHNLPEDAAISNAPGSLVDGDLSTCLSMVKPGKTYAGVKVEANEQVYATVNFKKQLEFNTIKLTNRNFQSYLNTKEVSFYGSNDGNTFTPIKTEVELPDAKANTIDLGTLVKYQYLKITFDAWDSSNGSTMQFAELEISKK